MNQIDDVELLHLFHQCSHQLHANRKYRGQKRLLRQLLENGTLTQRELIQMTGRRSATLSEQLDHMEKMGYITRMKNKQDKRQIDVALTSQGKIVAKEIQRKHKERAKILFSTLEENEKEDLYKLCQKLLSTWQNLSVESEEEK